MSQAEINALMIAYARSGRTVVRLKGGDPYVFGRGGEEALALAQAGVPFEVVPGVSSAIAVPAYAGIPVTLDFQISEQEWKRDIEVPPADLPLIIQSARNVGFGFHRLLPRVGLRADRFKPSAALRP